MKMTKKDKYIACYEHGKPEYFRTIAEISEWFGIRSEHAIELVKSYNKALVLEGGNRCWLDFLAVPGPEKKDRGNPLIAFFSDGRNLVFGSEKEAMEALGVGRKKLLALSASGEACEAEADGKKSVFFLDELFTGGDE